MCSSLSLFFVPTYVCNYPTYLSFFISFFISLHFSNSFFFPSTRVCIYSSIFLLLFIFLSASLYFSTYVLFSLYLCICLIYLSFVFHLSFFLHVFPFSLCLCPRAHVKMCFEQSKARKGASKPWRPSHMLLVPPPRRPIQRHPTQPFLSSPRPRLADTLSLHFTRPLLFRPQHLTSGFGFSVSFSVFRTISLTPFSVGSSQKHPYPASTTFTSLHFPAIIPPPAPHFRIWLLFSLSHFSAIPHAPRFLLGHIKNKLSSW